MNNEPVVPFGWFWFESEENKSPYTQITGYTYERFSTMKPDGSAKIDEGSLIPLYAHPVELTDEEMDTIVRDFFGEVDSFYDFRLVIRRCIRKASEK